MSQSFTTDDGVTLFEPGTVVSTKIIANQGGFAASGVVALIGESDEGPAWTEEQELDDNAFGPDQVNDVVAKYGEGKIVDAYRAIVSAANDPAIVGAVSLVKIVKTNASTKATADIERQGFGTYATLNARRAGFRKHLLCVGRQTGLSSTQPRLRVYQHSYLARFGILLNRSAIQAVGCPPLCFCFFWRLGSGRLTKHNGKRGEFCLLFGQ